MEEYTYQFIELARYAPEEVDKDEKKQDMFKKGLNPELRTLLTPQIYPDFNILMNMVILTERVKAEERKGNKRKFLKSKARQQDRFQKPRNSSYMAPRFRPQCSIGPSLRSQAHRPLTHSSGARAP